MRDAVSAVSEQQAFGDPVKFRELFTNDFTEVSTGKRYWAFISSSVNIGRSHYRGIDWELSSRQRFDFGNVTVNLSGTHMLKADYTRAGTSDEWTSSMNFFGTNNAVTFKNVARLGVTLD
ncbi:TonB-dependent receptor, partial [Acinetobacter baumannii]|uniref:hypothetical protein n=1 Tax=Acinetobacter baumannii TaxID=470 RepID=UPI0018E09200